MHQRFTSQDSGSPWVAPFRPAIGLVIAGLLMAGCSHLSTGSKDPANHGAQPLAPVGADVAEIVAAQAVSDSESAGQREPVVVTLSNLRAADVDFDPPQAMGKPSAKPSKPDYPYKKMRRELVANLRARAQFLAPNRKIADASRGAAESEFDGNGAGRGVTLSNSFDSLSYDDDPTSTPPDPELAVGPQHVIAVVNASFEVYDRSGDTLVGPTRFEDFFGDTEGCGEFLFDPNVLYDEKENRFFVAIDGSGQFYCLAVSQTGDPTGAWNLYSFPTTTPNDWVLFDYPHAGVGEDFIFLGANMLLFNLMDLIGVVWAIDKDAIYAGQSLPTPNFEVIPNAEITPQPMNAHGFAQGTWPSSGTHYIVTDGPFDGSSLGVWSWDGVGSLVSLGRLDLNAASGVTAGMPSPTPQSGGGTIDGRDWRVQDAEYRNGRIWVTQTIACNPGTGTVNCVRWAEVDPAAQGGARAVQSGVISSPFVHRQFPDLGVNHCGDVVIGYTRTSSGALPSIYTSTRLGTDPAGTTRPETLLRGGQVTYSGVEFESAPFRWGDYTGGTSDPNGSDLWYLGEYARDNTAMAKWGSYAGHFTTGCVMDEVLFADDFESGDCTAWNAGVVGGLCPALSREVNGGRPAPGRPPTGRPRAEPGH